MAHVRLRVGAPTTTLLRPVRRLASSSHPPPPQPPGAPPPAAGAFSPWDDRRIVAVCGSTAALMLGHGVASPILPLLATELGASAASVGMALSAFGLARLTLNVPVGLAADRLEHGPRALLIGGSLVAAAGTAACGVAADSSQLLAARLLAGAGNAAYLGATQIYLGGELSTPATRARVLGANHQSLLLGVSAGPVLGGLLADATGSLRAPWFAVASLSAIAAAHAATALPRGGSAAVAASSTTTVGGGGGGGATAWRELVSARFAVAGLAHAATFALRQGGRNLLLALVAVETFGYSPRGLGLLFGGMALVDLAAVGASSRRADAVADPRWVVVPAIAGAAGACGWVGCVAAVAQGQPAAQLAAQQAALVPALGGTPAELHGAFLCGVASWALSTASLGPALPAYAADLAPEGRHGLSTALFRSCGDAGFVLTPVALGALADTTSVPAAMGALAVGAGSTGVAFAAFGTPARRTARCTGL